MAEADAIQIEKVNDFKHALTHTEISYYCNHVCNLTISPLVHSPRMVLDGKLINMIKLVCRECFVTYLMVKQLH